MRALSVRSASVLAALGLAFFAFFVARPAHAFERQQHLGLDLGPVLMTTAGTSKLGIDLGMHYTYGVTDAFNLVGEVGWAGFTSSGSTGPQPSIVLNGGVGVVYVFDVLRWVPYAGALIGPAYFGGGSTDKSFVTPDGQLAAGLDYALSREWSIGAAYRQHVYFTKTDTYGMFGTLLLRAEYVWGW